MVQGNTWMFLVNDLTNAGCCCRPIAGPLFDMSWFVGHLAQSIKNICWKSRFPLRARAKLERNLVA